MHFMKKNKTWTYLVVLSLYIVTFLGCTPKNRGDVCDKEITDSIHIGNRAFAMSRDSIVQICDVRWRVNGHVGEPTFLVTTVQPDAPEMASVIQLIDSICGEHDEPEPLLFCWGMGDLRLRRVHTEEGGTLIFGRVIH